MARLIGTAVLISLVWGAIAAQALGAVSLNCSSTTSTVWQIERFTVDTASRYFYGNGTIGNARFKITNTANGYFDYCEKRSVKEVRPYRYTDWGNFEPKSDGKIWYTCGDFCSLSESPPLETSFSFDVVAKTLSVSQRWSCYIGSNPSTV